MEIIWKFFGDLKESLKNLRESFRNVRKIFQKSFRYLREISEESKGNPLRI